MFSKRVQVLLLGKYDFTSKKKNMSASKPRASLQTKGGVHAVHACEDANLAKSPSSSSILEMAALSHSQSGEETPESTSHRLLHRGIPASKFCPLFPCAVHLYSPCLSTRRSGYQSWLVTYNFTLSPHLSK